MGLAAKLQRAWQAPDITSSSPPVAAVAANSPTPQQRYGAEMRIYLREGNVEKTIHYCKLLGEECVKTETIRKRAPY